MDQVERPFEALRFPVSGGIPERLGISVKPPGISLLLPGNRTLLAVSLAGRERLQVARPGKDPVPFVESEEETAGPLTQVGETEVAFLAGSGPERQIAIASIADGRIRRRLSSTRGISVDNMAAAPDGKTIYYVAAGNAWSIPAGESGGQPHKVAAGFAIAVSPDGRELILLHNEQAGAKLTRLTLATGVEVAVPYSSDLRLSGISTGAVGRDGRILIDICPVESWFCPPAILDPTSGKVTRVPPPVEGDYSSISWTPDGRVFAAAEAMRATLWRFRLEK
jgi:hypothetical protein